MESSSEKILDISWGTIIKLALSAIVFYFIFQTRDILTLFIFSLIIAVLFNPAIDFLEKRKIPRLLSVFLCYFLVFGITGFLIYLVSSAFVSEIQTFSNSFHGYFDKISPFLQNIGGPAFKDFDAFIKTVQVWLTQASSDIFSAVGAIFGSIFSTFTIFFLAIFISLEEKAVERTLVLLFPKKYEANVLSIWQRVQSKVAGWFGARILSCLFVGILTFLACQIVGINYSFSFGLLAAITNIIPVIGPLVAGTVIVLFTMLDSLGKAVFILIIFVLIQQIEGNIVTPILSKKFIGLPPALVLIALMMGGRLWGIMGAFLAIPIFGILFEFVKEFLKKKRDERVVVL
jgi:predicted PurR-regulated permease PerM